MEKTLTKIYKVVKTTNDLTIVDPFYADCEPSMIRKLGIAYAQFRVDKYQELKSALHSLPKKRIRNIDEICINATVILVEIPMVHYDLLRKSEKVELDGNLLDIEQYLYTVWIKHVNTGLGSEVCEIVTYEFDETDFDSDPVLIT